MRDRGRLATLPDRLRLRAADQPSTTAFTWLADDPVDDVSINYADLDRRARAIATLLRQEGGTGERALLVFTPGLDFIAALFGCFYAGWIAVPAYPPPLNQRLGRIQSVVRDALPLVALTSTVLLQQLKRRLATDPDLGALRWRAVDVGDGSSDTERWAMPTASSTDVAVLQYTSGSTAEPRGAMLTHANLSHNAAQIERRFDVRGTPDSHGVIWLPPYHDMGLVGGILEGIYAGFPVSLMAPVAFLQRPRRWLEAISRTRATISGGPNFAYDLCVERIPPAQRAGLDLSCWTVAFNGSEPVRAATLHRFADAFRRNGFREIAFYPCYGLAEATLMVAGGRASDPPVVMELEDHRLVVGCGRAIDDQQVLIVDPTTRAACEHGQIGEVWVTGPSVAAGYWGQPPLTDAVFNASLLAPAGVLASYLRTGDLGFVDDAGELFITGRLKAVLIVGGRKIQAEDIEATLATGRSGIRPAGTVALSVDVDGEERLVVVHELHPQQSPAEFEALARSIRLRVAEAHQLPVWSVVLIRPGRVPRTSSGKVRRAACRQAFLAGQLEIAFKWRAQGSASQAWKGPVSKGDA